MGIPKEQRGKRRKREDSCHSFFSRAFSGLHSSYLTATDGDFLSNSPMHFHLVFRSVDHRDSQDAHNPDSFLTTIYCQGMKIHCSSLATWHDKPNCLSEVFSNFFTKE